MQALNVLLACTGEKVSVQLSTSHPSTGSRAVAGSKFELVEVSDVLPVLLP